MEEYVLVGVSPTRYGELSFGEVFYQMKNEQDCVGTDLSSRLVAKQVFSAQHSLTSVFGMGTGGPCALMTPTSLTHLFVFASTYLPGPSPGEYCRLSTA